MLDTSVPSAVAELVRELCRQFNLPTLAAETVGRFRRLKAPELMKDVYLGAEYKDGIIITTTLEKVAA